jgi:hypothetical protein
MSFIQPFFIVRLDDITQAIENSHYENNEVLIIGKREVHRGIFSHGSEIHLSKWLEGLRFPARMSIRESGIYTNANIMSTPKVFGEDKWLFAMRDYEPTDWPYLKNEADEYNYSWQKIKLEHLFGIQIEKQTGLEFIIWVIFLLLLMGVYLFS